MTYFLKRILNIGTCLLLLIGETKSMAKSKIDDQKKHAEVSNVLNQFHDAASKADGKRYFSYFAPEGVFIGTDAKERWSVEEFKAYAEPFFKKGKGWTYVARTRHIDFAPNSEIAWFDEILDNKIYGTCRGSGVLRNIDGTWHISQYHLTFPIPNELAEKVTKEIQAQDHR